jgi:hypothetical protein
VLLEDLTRQSPFTQPVERRWTVAANIGAIAAEFSMLAMTNLGGQAVVTVVDSILVSVGTSIEFAVGRGTGVGLQPLSAALYMDSRNGSLSPTLFVTGTNPATNLTEAPSVLRRVAVTEELLPKTALVIVPGEVWVVEARTVFIAATITVSGRDYAF